MHRATPLPAQLLDRPFRVSEAVELGVTQKRLRSNDLWAPYRGVRVRCALPWTPLLRARSGLLVCPPETVVVGYDAFAVAGLPLPFSEEVLLERRLAVAPPLSIDPFAHPAFDVRLLVGARSVPVVTEEGVPRPADADLWLRVALEHHRSRYPAGYLDRLGRVVLERTEGDLGPVQAAVSRLSDGWQGPGRRLVDDALAGLARG